MEDFGDQAYTIGMKCCKPITVSTNEGLKGKRQATNDPIPVETYEWYTSEANLDV